MLASYRFRRSKTCWRSGLFNFSKSLRKCGAGQEETRREAIGFGLLPAMLIVGPSFAHVGCCAVEPTSRHRVSRYQQMAQLMANRKPTARCRHADGYRRQEEKLRRRGRAAPASGIWTADGNR